MNRENLLRAIEHMKTVNADQFDMTVFNDGSDYDFDFNECNSAGCIIGHCAVIDKKRFFEISQETQLNGPYHNWSIEFFGIGNKDMHTAEWLWLFGQAWNETDNTLKGAIARMQYVYDNGFPEFNTNNTWSKSFYDKSVYADYLK